MLEGLANLTTLRAPLSGDVGEPEQIVVAPATAKAIFGIVPALRAARPDLMSSGEQPGARTGDVLPFPRMGAIG